MKTLSPVTTALALVATVNLSPAMAQGSKPSGFAPGTLRVQEGSDQSGLRDILADLASGRNVSARVSLPLQVGFFNGQTALYITPEVGVGQALSPPPNKSRRGSMLISFLRTSLLSLAPAR